MILVNNGKYRRTELEFKKFVNGSPVFTGGFPFSLSILNAFAEYPSLTEEEFARLSDQDYGIRLNAFYQYVKLSYPFFSFETHVPDINNSDINSNGDDADTCPIDLTPSSLNYIKLAVEYFDLGNGIREALVKAQAVNSLGNPVQVLSDIPFSFILKEFAEGQISNWDQIQGNLINAVIEQGTSETIIVERFRFRGTDDEVLPYKSVYVNLFEIQEDIEFSFTNPKTVSITTNLPAFLLNFISNINSSYQERLTVLQANDIAGSSNGAVNSGQGEFHFVFQPNVRQRPVLMYPASWGKLSEINFPQGGNVNIINDGAFQLDGTEPYEVVIEIDGASINYFVYSSSNLIIYPYKVDYYYRF